jgi:hypothetical protein
MITDEMLIPLTPVSHGARLKDEQAELPDYFEGVSRAILGGSSLLSIFGAKSLARRLCLSSMLQQDVLGQGSAACL